MTTINIPPEKMSEILEFEKLSPPYPGFKRQWVVCSECGIPQFYDYVHFSLEKSIRATRCQHDWSKMQEFDPMQTIGVSTEDDFMEVIAILKICAPTLLQTPAFQENPILLQEIKKAMLEFAISFYLKANGHEIQ